MEIKTSFVLKPKLVYHQIGGLYFPKAYNASQ